MADEKARTELEQNLRDAGCCPELISQILACRDKEQQTAMLSLLTRHRAELLEDVHRCQKRVDCLDYLIYQLKKQP